MHCWLKYCPGSIGNMPFTLNRGIERFKVFVIEPGFSRGTWSSQTGLKTETIKLKREHGSFQAVICEPK